MAVSMVGPPKTDCPRVREKVIWESLYPILGSIRPHGLREAIFERIRREHYASIETLLAVTDHRKLLEDNPLLDRSIRNRFPYLDPLNHIQIELLKQHRASGVNEQVLRGIQLTINGISAGLRNSG
jgi:phosphoenolpyruvate carboxylase